MATYTWTSTTSTDPTAGANWTKTDGTTGTAPTTGDTAYIVPIAGVTLSNISFADMSAVTLAALYINPPQGMTIGTFDTTSGNYFGYWKISATVWVIGTQDGTPSTGSQRIKINFGSVAYTGLVTQTSNSSIDQGYAPLRILGTSSSNVLSVLAGNVSVGMNLPGETSDLSGGVNVSSGLLTLGAGVTWVTANVTASATLVTNSGGTTLNVSQSGTATLNGTAIVTTVNTAGAVFHNARPASGAGTTTATLTNTGVMDFTGNPAAVTVTTMNQYGGSVVRANPANPGHLTVTTRNLKLCGSITAS